MNRLVLIGNGFDMAHGLKTGYHDFINWYWAQRRDRFVNEHSNVSEDILCRLENLEYDTWSMALMYDTDLKQAKDNDIYKTIIKNDKIKKVFSPFFDRINQNAEIKGWVDIENEYYYFLKKFALEDNDETKVKELNNQLQFIQDKLIEYLKIETQKELKPILEIDAAIYNIISPQDVSVEGTTALQEHIEGGVTLSEEHWKLKLENSGILEISEALDEIRKYKESNQGASLLISKIVNKTRQYFGYKKKTQKGILDPESIFNIPPRYFYFPNNVMILNFNYTKTAEMYCHPKGITKILNLSPLNQIHGNLDDPESVIFGYGDEMDEEYKEIVKKNDNTFLSNIKSIKYLESMNYRRILSFIEYEPYQVIIMGHSCGNSDRTLLNTLFEHKNCVSIKPYYHLKKNGTDNYLELVQNISRNFTDMKLMRDRVVNKTFCEPLIPKESENERRVFYGFPPSFRKHIVDNYENEKDIMEVWGVDKNKKGSPP